jgi:hypothetical protein
MLHDFRLELRFIGDFFVKRVIAVEALEKVKRQEFPVGHDSLLLA